MLAAVVTAAADLGETHIATGASPGAPPKASSGQTDDVREPLRSANAWGGGGAVKHSARDSKLPLEPASKDPNAKSEVLGEVLHGRQVWAAATSKSLLLDLPVNATAKSTATPSPNK